MGDIGAELRGLFERRFGDGVNGGLPGRDGAQTICSGVTESPETEKFSLLSRRFSKSMRTSCFIIDLSCRERPGDRRRTERSNGADSL